MMYMKNEYFLYLSYFHSSLNYHLVSGSKNLTKVKAIEYAASRYWEDYTIYEYDAPSRVQVMPMNKDDTRIGAKNRAKAALQWIYEQKEFVEGDVVIGIGNEGGVAEMEGVWYLFSSTFATDGILCSRGGETLVRMPEIMIDQLEGGRVELADIIDKMTGENDTRQKGGAIALLTRNKIKRQDLFNSPVMQALSPWVSGFSYRIVEE